MLFLLAFAYGFYGSESFEMGTVTPKVQATTYFGRVMLQCHSEGKVKWLLNRNLLRTGKVKLGHNKTLVFQNVNALYSGEYTCIGTYRKHPSNDLSGFTDTAIVYVGAPAQHRITPSFSEVNVGDSAYFSCHSQLVGHLQIKPIPWIFENAVYADVVAKKRGFNSIFIESANLTHNGLYTCFGLKTSHGIWNNFVASAQLHVYDNDLIFPKRVVVDFARSVAIQCYSRSPPLWSYEGMGKRTLNSMHNVELHGTTLTIQYMLAFNVGYYHCNGETEDFLAIKGLSKKYQTFYAKSEVWMRGAIYVEPSSQAKDIGDDVEFLCYTYNAVRWTFNKGRLPDNCIVSGKSNEILTISKVNRDNSGTYECSMVDRNEYYSSTANLKVYENPDYAYSDKIPKSTNILRKTKDFLEKLKEPEPSYKYAKSDRNWISPKLKTQEPPKSSDVDIGGHLIYEPLPYSLRDNDLQEQQRYQNGYNKYT